MQVPDQAGISSLTVLVLLSLQFAQVMPSLAAVLSLMHAC